MHGIHSKALKLSCIPPLPELPGTLPKESPYWALQVYTAQIQGAFHKGLSLNNTAQRFSPGIILGPGIQQSTHIM